MILKLVVNVVSGANKEKWREAPWNDYQNHLSPSLLYTHDFVYSCLSMMGHFVIVRLIMISSGAWLVQTGIGVSCYVRVGLVSFLKSTQVFEL